MNAKPLPEKDAGILRDYAIPYFKSRFPEYSGLDLSLNGDRLIVNCHEADPLDRLIREIWEINSKAKIAIGISRVNLEFNGVQILNFEEEDFMVAALLEEEKVSINGNIPKEIIELSTPERKSAPETIKLIPLTEALSRLDLDKKDYDKLLKCLDHSTQKYFKQENLQSTTALLKDQLKLPQNIIDLSMQLIELHEMNNIYAIKEIDIEKNNRAIKAWFIASEVPLMLRNVQANLRNGFADIIDDSPSESPIASSELIAEETPKKRGRKAKVESSGESKPKKFNININPEDTIFQNVLKNSRYKQAAEKILTAIGKRRDEFLALAAELDPIAIKAMDGLLAKFIQEESRRETVKSNIFKHLSKIAQSSSSSEGEPDAESDF